MAKAKAKAKATKSAQEQGAIIMDTMPGADPSTEPQSTEAFEVNLDFTEEPKAEEAEAETEEQVEFPKEEVVAEEQIEAAGEAETSQTEAETEAVEEASPSEVKDEVQLEEPPAKKPKAPMVPKSRLDEVLAKNKKMQKELSDIQQKEAEAAAEAPKYDFSTKEAEYQQLILDGESAKAVELRGDIRKAEKEQLMFEVQQQMGQNIQQNQAEQELATKAAEIAGTFSILDENSSDFSQELTQEVLELRDAFIVQGYTPSDSLAKATEYTLAAKKPELLQPAEAKAATQTKKVVEKRQKVTVKKKLEAAKAQPPELKGEGANKHGDQVPDLNVLSDDEFGALPEETLKRMRGDFG